MKTDLMYVLSTGGGCTTPGCHGWDGWHVDEEDQGILFTTCACGCSDEELALDDVQVLPDTFKFLQQLFFDAVEREIEENHGGNDAGCC